MHHKYDLFEKFPDGSSLWRASVVGLHGTRQHLLDLAQRSPNKFYAMHWVTGKIVSHESALGGSMAPQKSGRRTRAAAA